MINLLTTIFFAAILAYGGVPAGWIAIWFVLLNAFLRVLDYLLAYAANTTDQVPQKEDRDE